MSDSSANAKQVKTGVPRWIWLLTLLVAGLTILFVIGSEADEDYDPPSVTSERAGGLEIFAKVLAKNGYKYRVETSEKLRVENDETLIVTFNGLDSEVDEDMARVLALPGVKQYFSSGKTLFALGVNNRMQWNAGHTYHWFYASPQSRRMGIVGLMMNTPSDFSGKGIWGTFNEESVVESTRNSQHILWFAAGQGLINQYIAQAENSDLFLILLSSSQPSKKLVFYEHFSGPEAKDVKKKSLWSRIGPWAAAAYLQFLLSLAVLAYTVSQRFGEPIQDTYEARGNRELIHAFGDLMYRCNQMELAGNLIGQNIDLRLRRALNLASSADIKARNERIPEDMARDLSLLSNVDRHNSRPNEVAKLVRKLLLQLEEIEKKSRTRGLRSK